MREEEWTLSQTFRHFPLQWCDDEVTLLDGEVGISGARSFGRCR